MRLAKQSADLPGSDLMVEFCIAGNMASKPHPPPLSTVAAAGAAAAAAVARHGYSVWEEFMLETATFSTSPQSPASPYNPLQPIEVAICTAVVPCGVPGPRFHFQRAPRVMTWIPYHLVFGPL